MKTSYVVKIKRKMAIIFIFCFGCTQKKDDFFLTKNKEIELIHLGQLTEKEAYKIGQDRVQLLMDGLDPQYDPYTGINTLAKKCQKENLPQLLFKKTDKDFYYLVSLYSSKYKSIGICSDPKNLLKTQYLILYCKSAGKLVIAKFFYEDKKDWILTPQVECR